MEELLFEIQRVEKFFNKKDVVTEAYAAFQAKDYDAVEKALSVIPTDEEMLKELLEKLKEKSVYKTLHMIHEGKADHQTELKGWFSLGTHIVIEMETDRRYGCLLGMVYEKIGNLVFEL